jgi:multiple sugar transport system permease protein
MNSNSTCNQTVRQKLSGYTANLLDQDAIAPWIFLAPALILLSLFLLYPIVYLIYLSFTQGSFTRAGVHWIGFRNYTRLFISADFWQVILNTVYFSLATLIPSLLIPLGLAIGLKQTSFQGILRAAYFIPSVTSMVGVGLGFRWLFQNDGPVNMLLQSFGSNAIDWLSNTTWAMPVLILLSSWKQLGFNLVVFLAGLQTIPNNRYEAAQLDGANAWQRFRHITLPGLKPTLVFAIVTTTIFTLRSFEQVYVVTGGGPMNSTNLLVYYIYDQAFAQFDFGYAGAGAAVLLAIAFLLVYAQFRTTSE